MADSLEVAKERRVQVPIEVAGHSFALQPDGARSFHIRLVNHDLTVLVGDGVEGFRVQIKANAVYLATTPLDLVLATFKALASRLLAGTIQEARVWRLDLCADATFLDFFAKDSENFIGRARKRVHCETRELSGSGGQKFTGFLIARGNPLSVRLYDKTEELRSQQRPDSAKTRTEQEHWHLAGWDGVAPVWRLEFQLRSAAINELGARDPVALLCSLDALWGYLAGRPREKEGWLRLTEPDNSRRERRSIDLRWETFRNAVFDARAAPCTRSPGNGKGSPLIQTVGNVLSTLGSWGVLKATTGQPEDWLSADFELLKKAICGDPRLLRRYCELREGKIAACQAIAAE